MSIEIVTRSFHHNNKNLLAVIESLEARLKVRHSLSSVYCRNDHLNNYSALTLEQERDDQTASATKSSATGEVE